MSSTILYKFRSGTTFEALPLPGSAARLFDIKKAIVTAKKLDQGSMEFDLSVRDATTNEEYTDETMLLPRGTRLVVQRLPAAKGHGFLTRMARNQYGGAPAQAAAGSSVPNNFYTIESRAHDDDEEFVRSDVKTDEEKELEALRAATEVAGSAASGGAPRSAPSGRGGFGQRGPAGSGPPPAHSNRHQGDNFQHRHRPNADPELRDQEKELQPKKRATGIPRTFLNLSAPPATDGTGEGGSVPLLQPNVIGFQELVTRRGGQSESASGTKRDLDYALKVTSTTIPEYLQCALCGGVVKDAMMLPWDPEGRTTCETCIRDALNQSGFVCPLSGIEGVSPDDLLPNHALRKAADVFIKGVMDKMEEIDTMAVDDVDDNEEDDATDGKKNVDLEGDQGVVLSKRASLLDKKKRQEQDDPFGAGDDDFGGDVFAVEAEKPVEEEVEPSATDAGEKKEVDPAEAKKDDLPPSTSEAASSEKQASTETAPAKEAEPVAKAPERAKSPQVSPPPSGLQQRQSHAEDSGRRDNRRRGPPAGYTMGPAGGAVGGPHADDQHRQFGGGRDNGRGGRYGGRGPSPRARHDSSHNDNRSEDGDTRGTKRSRSASMSDSVGDRDDSYQGRGRFDRGGYGGRDSRDFGRGGRFRGGGRGRWDDQGRGYAPRGGGQGRGFRGRGSGDYRGGGRGYRGGRGRY